MTAGSNGSGAPAEDDDPFGHLYRSDDGPAAAAGQGGGTAAGSGTSPRQPGVPRTSYHQVRAVGEHRYPGAAPQRPQGPSPHYAAPETLPGGRAAARQRRPAEPGRGRGGGRGLLVGAVAVVAAVVLGVGAAIYFSEDGDETTQGGGPSASPSATKDDGQGGKPDDKPEKPDLPSGDAATFTLGGDAVVRSDIPGAEAVGGRYVTLKKPGSSATWTTKVEQGGQYRLYVGYSVPGEKRDLTLWVNGEKRSQPLNMDNFAKAPKGDWEKGWTWTYALVNVEEGSNTFKLSCEEGNACDVAVDRAWLAEPEGGD